MQAFIGASTRRIVNVLLITVFVAICITIIWEFFLGNFVSSLFGWKPDSLEEQLEYTVTIITFILLSLIVPAFLLIKIDRQRSKNEWLLQKSHYEISLEVKKRTKELEIVNIELENKIIEIENSQKALAKGEELFMKKLVDRQEDERRRIGSDIHDSLGQNLLFIKNNIENYISFSGVEDALLDSVVQKVSETVEDARRISGNLHPHILTQLGLSKAIVSMVEASSQASSINFDLHIQDLKNIYSKKDEINIFRIVQEALNNILKHSEATEVEIVAILEDGSLVLTMNDNGRGIPSSRPAGFGINSIESRVKLLGGKFKLKSEDRNGTRLSITIPKSLIAEGEE